MNVKTMSKSDLQQSFYESPHQQQQPSPQLPDHLKCGEVYTWLCAGEMFAVECKLCEDQPLCPLSEFPQHMEIWHTQWQETFTKTHERLFRSFSASESEEELQFVKEISSDKWNNDCDVTFATNKVSGLLEIDTNHLHNEISTKTQTEHEEILEPFEQVLIEQDLAIDTTIQISEEVNEEEYIGDVDEQTAATAAAVATETEQFQIENQQQQLQTFVEPAFLALANKEPLKENLKHKESELQNLTEDTRIITEKFVFCPAENCQNNIQSKKQNHINIQNESESETSGNETNLIDCIKIKKHLKKSKRKPKTMKLNHIEKALSRIKTNICELRQEETDEMESETSAIENNGKKQSLFNYKNSEINVMANETKCLSKEILLKASINNKIKAKAFEKSAKPKRPLSNVKQNHCLHAKNLAIKILKSNEKQADRQLVLGYIRKHKRYRRKKYYQKYTRTTPGTSFESQAETREIPALRPINENEEEEKNPFTKEITSIGEEIWLLDKNKDQIIAWEHKISQAKEIISKGSLNSINTEDFEDNNASAQDWPEVLETFCKQNSIQVKETSEEQTQYGPANQEENLAEDIIRQRQQADSLESNRDRVNSWSNSSLNSFGQHITLSTIAEPVSPVSPKTEEEHFEFYEPKEKLNKQHISHLIKLYQEHPRLWNQSHPDFCEPQMCRQSWQQITEDWNKYCKRKFTIAEVRIRISTLCQRFVQEKRRLALEGELDECAKFPYYEQMKFLEHQKSLRKRRELYEQQNEKILEIYQYFPILWHVRHYKARQAKRRAEAFESVSQVLKLFGWHLSSLGVQKRLRSLRKCYRLEKIRHLHAQVEQTPFQTEFRHYEKMQFLDKHIDPFVCRICGKIFENLSGFREHLEAENHGSISQPETDTENLSDNNEREDDTGKSVELSGTSDYMECFTESENSTDILQRFMPLPATPQSAIENNYSQNMSPFPLSTSNDEALINSWPFEDQLIEEIMENVSSHNDGFSQHGLDQFINSVTSCEELTNGTTNLFEEVLSPSLLHTDNSFIVEHPDIISRQTGSFIDPPTNAESLISLDIGNENSLNVQQADLLADHNFSVPLPAEETVIATTAEEISLQSNVEMISPIKELENQITAEVIAEQASPSSTALLVKVQCADYLVNLKLNTETLTTHDPYLQDSDNDLYSSGDNSTAPLPDLLIHKMIELYRKFPQLWDPNHLDYNSRILRREAWVSLTTEFNLIVCKQLSWRTLHRKLTDYAKYYKKLVTEQGNYKTCLNKWLFYEDFKFLDDVIAVNTELQRSVHHRDNNFKIISTYKSFPQLWNIKHPDFSKRSCKQRNFELMCNKLQEENNLQLTTERLKNRLIELRAQYRTAKKQRLKCLKIHQPFSASEFEFYEALNFLDDHIDPFVCDKCKMEFKKLTDYNQHWKREHVPKKQCTVLPPPETAVDNVCHICGTKFTTRSNLVHHIKRHEGIRNYACTMCAKKFYASHALKVHIRSHTKECPYTCEKCGMSFVSASKLNQHVKRHLNQKDFECSYCPKTFFTAFEKDRHERRHLNIRDKICPICGKTFVVGSSYYAHLMLHNDTKRFECDKCDMKFAQYPGLFKHKKRHHT